jgi:phosphohistidine phosphatase
MAMELILWRHAEAVDGFPDQNRALTKKGHLYAERMAEFLIPRLPSDIRILVSPALRAQQTASTLTRKFITESAVNVHASAQNVLTAADWPYGKHDTLVVGHQPWLGEIAALLMTGTADSWSVKKGSVWWFSCRERDGEIQTNLRLVITPEQL